MAVCNQKFAVYSNCCDGRSEISTLEHKPAGSRMFLSTFIQEHLNVILISFLIMILWAIVDSHSLVWISYINFQNIAIMMTNGPWVQWGHCHLVSQKSRAGWNWGLDIGEVRD
jgi:hypothetical protein